LDLRNDLAHHLRIDGFRFGLYFLRSLSLTLRMEWLVSRKGKDDPPCHRSRIDLDDPGAPIFIVISGLALYLLSFRPDRFPPPMIIEMHRMATTPILVAILFLPSLDISFRRAEPLGGSSTFRRHSRLVARWVVDHRRSSLVLSSRL